MYIRKGGREAFRACQVFGALDGGCRVKHHGQGQHDVPGWADDAGEASVSRPTRLARDRNKQGGGRENRRDPTLRRPEGGWLRSTRDRLQRHGTEHCTAESIVGALPRETRWQVFMDGPKETRRMWSGHDAGAVVARVCERGVVEAGG
jgi:hypothetical protein